MSAKSKIIRIENAEYVGANMLRLLFSDGKKRVVDFAPFLEKSQHPQIRKFLNPKRFRKFTIDNGDLMWGDYDLIFPIMDLYKNKIDSGKRIAGNPQTP